MKLALSIRFKLTVLFLLTIVIPVMVIVVELPSYYETLITKQAASLTDGTLTALTYNIETYLDDLDRLTITPYLNDDVMQALKLKASRQWETSSAYAKFEAERALSVTLPKFLKTTRKDILGTILLPNDGSVYATSPFGVANPVVPDYPFARQDWYKQAVQADGNIAFISVHDQSYLESATPEVFSVARLIKDPDSQKPLAVIMADADTIVLERIIKEVRFDAHSIVAIFDDRKKLLYSNDSLSNEVLGQLAAGKKSVKDSKDSYRVVDKTISRSNWSIVVLFPDSVIKSQLHWIYLIGYWLTAAGLLVALLLYFTVSRWIVVPFKQMVQVMKKVQRGHLKTYFPVRGKDEIAQLGASLNTMITQLGDLIDSEYRAVLGQRVAEYRALQSQIQPHFLYNTLNGFIGLNRMGERHVLEKAILSLSGLLRYILEHNDWALLKDEMDFVEKYCELQQIRFREKLQFRVELDPDAAYARIPKLLLQPLVENAIIHGIEPQDQPCSLIVAARKMTDGEHAPEEYLEIRIADDGIGFDPGIPKENVGLNNVRERLKLAYENASFCIESKPGHGTVVYIRIPLKDVNG